MWGDSLRSIYSGVGVAYLAAPRLYSNHKHQLGNDERHTQLNVDIVPQTPEGPEQGGREVES